MEGVGGSAAAGDSATLNIRFCIAGSSEVITLDVPTATTFEAVKDLLAVRQSMTL